jgi:hypothetical protein
VLRSLRAATLLAPPRLRLLRRPSRSTSPYVNYRRVQLGPSSICCAFRSLYNEEPQGSIEPPPEAPSPQSGTPNLAGKLRALAEAREAGLITPEEFEAKKSNILDNL